MRKTTLVYWMAAGLALLPVTGAFAAANPAAPNPYPTRESKVLVDFETDVTVAGDPNGTGENATSIVTDAALAAEGSKALKLDMTDAVSGWHDNNFTIDFAQPIDIKGYQVLAMDVFIPDDSISDSWYQFDPTLTTTNADDETQTTGTFYGPGNMHKGWNHLIWTLKNGTDTKVTQIKVSGNSGADYTGPLYIDNIRVYKGNFVGLQPDEQLVFGFEKPTDKDLFTTLGDTVTVDVNTDKQFVTSGESSLKIDLTGHPSGYITTVAGVEDWGTTLDVSKATAIHLDFFIPADSFTEDQYHEMGFVVVGEGGTMQVVNYITDEQWVTLQIPLTPEQATMLGNIKGISFITNSGGEWAGPVYVDSLRAVTGPPPAAGG